MDIKFCLRQVSSLEEKLGHDKVVELIEYEAKMELKFDAYPKSADFLLNLRETMIDRIIS